MESNAVLANDVDDNILIDAASTSTKATHTFSSTLLHGILHQAFSVFLFDASSTSELLLQRRAPSQTLAAHSLATPLLMATAWPTWVIFGVEAIVGQSRSSRGQNVAE